MSGTLRQARILSSETDTNNNVTQSQNTNVNIKITPRAAGTSQTGEQQRPQTVPLYPNVQPLNQGVNFTQANNQPDMQPNGLTSNIPMMNQESQFPSVAPISSNSLLAQERGIIDLGTELDTLEKKNKFLEILVEMYEGNPLKVNSYVVCESKLLMDMIKLLTECEKVEFVLDDSDVGCGCTSSPSKFTKVSKILITKDGKTEDMKYAYNNIYSQFIKYGLSLKLVV